jgi:hypothetical protein
MFAASHRNLHTKRLSIQSDIYQMSYWYNKFSWWWAHGCPKHVENINKHTWKLIVRQVVYLQRTCGSWIFIVNPKSSCRCLWFNCTTAIQYGRSATLWHFSVLWPSSSNTAVVELAYCCPYMTYFAKDRNCNTDLFTGTSRCRDCIRHREVSSQRGGPGSIPGQSTWHVWWTECYCNRRSNPSVTVLLLHSHLHLIFALTRRTNGRLGTSKRNVVPEIGDTWLGQYFCLVCTGFKINGTRGG